MTVLLFTLLKVVHILLFATWLGVDLGAFACGYLMRGHDTSPEARGAFGRLRDWIELGPRLSLALTVPVVLSLVVMGRYGLSDIPSGDLNLLLLGITVVIFVWCALIWRWIVGPLVSDRRPLPVVQESEFAFRLDTGIRLILIVLFLGLLPAGGGLLAVGWLQLKSLIFGLVIATSLWVRIVSRSTSATLAEIITKGSTAEREAVLERQLQAAVLPSVLTWTGIVANIFVAVTRVG